MVGINFVTPDDWCTHFDRYCLDIPDCCYICSLCPYRRPAVWY